MEGAHRRRFKKAFDAILEEMDRHQPEKGDSWEKMRGIEIARLLRTAVNDYMIGSSHAIDIAALAIMVHLKAIDEGYPLYGFFKK